MTRVVSLSAVLERMGACGEALRWVRSTGNERFADTWHACPFVTWSWWLAVRVRPYLPRDVYSAALTGGNIRDYVSADMLERAILAWWEAQSCALWEVQS